MASFPFRVILFIEGGVELTTQYSTKSDAKELSLDIVNSTASRTADAVLIFVDDKGTRFHVRREAIVAVVMESDDE